MIRLLCTQLIQFTANINLVTDLKINACTELLLITF